jgi:DnaJ family protein C protein 7
VRSKRQRYDSGVDLQDPDEMFNGGMGGFGGGQGMQIDPTMLFNMMNGGGGGGMGGHPGFSFQTGGGGFGGMPGGSRRGGGFQGGGFPF